MRKSAEERKREIVDAALRLSVEVGPDRLTTPALALAVGISQPAIFRHFPTLAELWIAIAETIAVRMRAAWRDGLDGAAAPEAMLRCLVATQLGLVAREPAILAIVFSHELRVANPRLAAVFRGLMAELTDRLGSAFATAGSRVRIPPRDAALLVLSFVQGQALRWAVGGGAFDLVAEALRLFDLQLAGLLRPDHGEDR